jgi:hypothetical protein
MSGFRWKMALAQPSLHVAEVPKGEEQGPSRHVGFNLAALGERILGLRFLA